MLALFDFAATGSTRAACSSSPLIVFAESGLLIGFFLPGDSLLFFAGFLASGGRRRTSAGRCRSSPPWPFVAAVARRPGRLPVRPQGRARRCSTRPQCRLFNPANVVKAQAFFDKHGPKTIVLARFVPIVRTFAPIVAGVGKMKYRTFVTYNVIGGVLWGVGVTTLGYFLGQIEFVKDNLEIAAIVIVAISLLPVVIESSATAARKASVVPDSSFTSVSVDEARRCRTSRPGVST